MCLMEACDLNFTHNFKKLNKNICVKTEGNKVVEENTEIEKKEKVRTVQKILVEASDEILKKEGF